jgi:hypothetical protein
MWPDSSYYRSEDGWSLKVGPDRATVFKTKEDAMNHRLGHHPDMGGRGLVGKVVLL